MGGYAVLPVAAQQFIQADAASRHGLVQALAAMETITRIFQSLDFLIEVFSVLIAISGLLIAVRGYRLAGMLIAVGSGLHALGYFLITHGGHGPDLTPLRSLLISAMYPGLLLLTLGFCCLALSLRTRRRGV